MSLSSAARDRPAPGPAPGREDDPPAPAGPRLVVAQRVPADRAARARRRQAHRGDSGGEYSYVSGVFVCDVARVTGYPMVDWLVADLTMPGAIPTFWREMSCHLCYRPRRGGGSTIVDRVRRPRRVALWV